MTTHSAPQIRDGIEWFPVPTNSFGRGDDAQCARCGSSVEYVRCSNCEEGLVEEEGDWGMEGWGDRWYRCDWCEGHGGHWACISDKELCEANPLPGREHIASTAYAKGTWPND